MSDEIQAPARDATWSIYEVNRVLAALWQEVLQTSELPEVGDNFFALGGDSMTMVMLEFRIQEEFSLELPAGFVLGAPTLRELSNFVHSERSGPKTSDDVCE